jgi:hypothetical protein
MPRQPRFYLELESDVVEAPAIGSKTARRLRKIGITTVSDLLAADCEQAAERIGAGYIDAQTFADWQAQARLVCCIPHLRGHDAQILVACDFRSPEDLAGIDADEVLPLIADFAESPAGERLLRELGKNPDLAEVRRWLQWAAKPRELTPRRADASRSLVERESDVVGSA